MFHSLLPLPPPVSCVSIATLILITSCLWSHPPRTSVTTFYWWLSKWHLQTQEGTFGADRNILYLDCGGVYMTMYIYQYSPHVKISVFLNVNYTSMKVTLKKKKWYFQRRPLHWTSNSHTTVSWIHSLSMFPWTSNSVAPKLISSSFHQICFFSYISYFTCGSIDLLSCFYFSAFSRS